MVFRRRPTEELVVPGIEKLKKPKDLVRSLRKVDAILEAQETELSKCIIDDIQKALMGYFAACAAGEDAHAHLVGASLARTIFKCIESLDASFPEMHGSLKAFVQTIDYYYKVQKNR